MKFLDEDLISTDPVPFLSTDDVSVYTLRLDKIHPVISGNKWFKLKYYLQDAVDANKECVVTFGGAYSNHIVATAAACHELNLQSQGIIRGEEPKDYGSALKTAARFNMQLTFISREAYKNKSIPDQFKNEKYYIIPEGGYGLPGARGVEDISYIQSEFDTLCCAVGTGTMMAGFMNGADASKKILGFSVMRNNFSLEKQVKNLLRNPEKTIHLNHQFSFGGYAKYTPQLIEFMNELFAATGIPTDFVYTAKLFCGVKDLIRQQYFPKGSKILIIHSGGLQGNLSLNKGTLIF